MTASASPLPIVREALGALVDYAGLFPPAELPLEAALYEYFEALRGPHSWMLGRFIVRSAQLGALQAALPAGQSIELSVIAGGDVPAAFAALEQLRERGSNIRIEVLEAPAGEDGIAVLADARARSGLDAVPLYIEAPASAMDALARARTGAKIRCGGADAAAYPSAAQIAAFIKAASERGVPFKATAGLHHPVRGYHAAAGVTMHGFLNLLAVTALARSGSDLTQLTAAAGCEDAAAFTFEPGGFGFRGRFFNAHEMRDVRERGFIAYGSCSFSEPVEDLRAMGMLP
ncbi:MAG: hypothetical protein ABR508_08765 [Candidatus Baltobacteraceae bacterium]